VACLIAAPTFAKNSDNSAGKSGGSSARVPFSIDKMSYVEGNILATFYHELGHALIDNMNLPVYAREEDAADNFALVLTEAIHDSLRAEQITWASADQYLEIARASKGIPLDYSDTHSPDMMRYYTLICLYYGANIQKRQGFANDNKLTEGRAPFCEDERAMAQKAWGSVLHRITRHKEGSDWLFIGLVDESDNPYVIAAHKVILDSVAQLNSLYDPDFTLSVDMTNCDEDNAFYSAEEQKIIMCNEYVAPLVRSAPDL